MIHFSKTHYLQHLQCPKLLWYFVNRPSQVPPPTESQQHRMREGQKVESYARKLFPEGILVDHSNGFEETVAQSKEAISRSDKPIFNAILTADSLIAETDILLPVEDEFEIYEVKSGSREKDKYIPDIAFQKYVAQKAGLRIRKSCLITVNTSYVRHREISAQQLFSVGDVSDAVDFEMQMMESQIGVAKSIIRLREPPSSWSIGTHCPSDCPLRDMCWRDVDRIEGNVFSLYAVRKTRSCGWYKIGIVKITQIPEDDIKSLNDKQRTQIEAEKTGNTYIDRKEVGGFLDQLRYPLHFLDFETTGSPIPSIHKSKPYEQIPFQFSLHIMDSLDAEPEHHSWIWDGREDDGDPRKEMLERLKALLGNTGSIIAYSAPFERSVLKRAVEVYPEYQEWLTGVLDRIVDLAIPFKNFSIYHPKQQGSYSIKAVLPALTGKSYEGMAISDGKQAGREYLKILEGQVSGKEKEEILRGLEKYCGQDTWGMVEILRVTKKEEHRN